MPDIKQLTEKIIKFRDARDWKQFHNPKDMAMDLSIEAAEVLELFLWKDKQEIDEYIKKNKEEISDELADVFYAILLISHDLKINIAQALEGKIKKNDKKYPVEKARGVHTKYNKL
ncbi:nucleotide pyrophosphohydrolase [Candidatus Parcubacteria bacterium]|nr:nucleotide pyrophosphohydrolase [Patescibacteria group bacterium]MBU4482420.1 nucleotide pyrophosphohydrolase [Patescibacteria group bacterium]MCG2686713.1 nucleotide pyrophosphohydrolase [Candidatus Parcubacteria bacterium]